MLGAIAGDIIGSSYEWHNTKSLDFDLFTPVSSLTDDSVLTITVADCILPGKDHAKTFKEYGHRYPRAGYGGMFVKWLGSKDLSPYNSFENGSAMRDNLFNYFNIVLHIPHSSLVIPEKTLQ